MSKPLRLAVLTTGRQDWGVLRPLCSELRATPGFSLSILAGGMACSQAFGRVSATVVEQGFEIAAELAWQVEGAEATVQAAEALRMAGLVLRKLQPDALVLVGDRYETAAVALAATLETIPIVHLYGGEESEGAFDNSLRHAITKLSHLHFVAHPQYAQRVVQMGEPPGTVHVVGSLGVDNLLKLQLPGRDQLESALGVELVPPIGLVTVHPTTLRSHDEPDEVEAVVAAMRRFPATWVVTLPNADPGSVSIREAFEELAATTPRVRTVAALGEERYLGLMKLADFVLGNSSSGITEAPSLRVPTINVGERQRGRVRSNSVLDAQPTVDAILRAISTALNPEWRAAALAGPLPFGDGAAAERIVTVLRAWTPPCPPRKVFFGLTRSEPGRTRVTTGDAA